MRVFLLECVKKTAAKDLGEWLNIDADRKETGSANKVGIGIDRAERLAGLKAALYLLTEGLDAFGVWLATFAGHGHGATGLIDEMGELLFFHLGGLGLKHFWD
jgi:hypothetical protein